MDKKKSRTIDDHNNPLYPPKRKKLYAEIISTIITVIACFIAINVIINTVVNSPTVPVIATNNPSDVNEKNNSNESNTNSSTNKKVYSNDLSKDYIIPDSSSKEITFEQLDGINKIALRYAINEIYARHGYLFQTPELRSYFDTKTWYKEAYQKQSYTNNNDVPLNEIEKKNIDTFARYRSYKRWDTK